MNVRTLAPRLDVVLGWGFDVLVMSEVRVARPAIRSLSRVMRSKGFDAVFGVPPPPSPTFSVRPGGLAVVTKLPLSVRKVHPPELSYWEEAGRIVIADVIDGDAHLYVLAIYGYAPSHEEHTANDSLLTECMAWAGRQKVCVLFTGDMNETVHTSGALASSMEHNMRRISPDSPSTAGKHASVSKQMPIDHALVNLPLWDCLIESRFRYDLPLADHYPIVSVFRSPSSLPLSWSWPKPCREFPSVPVVQDVPFPDSANTFTAWSEQSRHWLQESYGVAIAQKTMLSASSYSPPLHPPPKEYAHLIKIVRAILHLQKLDRPHWGQTRYLHLKLDAIQMIWDGQHESLEALLVAVKQKVGRAIQNLQEDMLRKWRQESSVMDSGHKEIT